MPIPSIPATPYGALPERWSPWLSALESWQPSAPVVRPQLYQPAGDRRIVVDQLANHPGLLDQYRKAAESALHAVIPAPENGLRAVGDLFSKAVACANWWLLDYDEKAAQQAWAITQAIMKWPRWVADEHLPLTIDLRTAHAMNALSDVLDRMSDWLNASQREEIVSCLRDRGVTPFLEIHDAHSEWWTYSLHNWRSVIDGAHGIAALSIRDTLPEDLLKRVLKHAVIGALTVLDQGDDDGGWFEGVSYWRYGIGEAVQFMDVLQRVTGGQVDLFTHPYIAKTGDFALFETWPDGRVHDWGDCGNRVNATSLMARLARATQRRDWQAYVRKFPSPPSIETLFWEDEALEPADLSGLSRAKHFRGTEVAVLRAGWADEDVIVGLKAGKTTANHSHLDLGSFVISAGKHSLVADSGHWAYAHSLGFFDLDFPDGARWDFPGLATECHSTVLVDGQGQRYGDEHDAVIVACRDEPDYAFATMDVTRAYPQLVRFVRYVLLIRPDTVVVIDDLASRERRRFGWRIVTPATPVKGESLQNWSVKTEDDSRSLALRCLMPDDSSGFMAETAILDAGYPSTGGRGNHTCRTLTLSNLVRSTQQVFAVAMRVCHGSPTHPDVTVSSVYRGLQVKTTGGEERTWAIMWGEPGIALVAG